MNNFSFTPFPELKTENLSFRQLEPSDENAIFTLRSDDGVNMFLDRPRANSIEDAREFINTINNGIAKDESILWAITMKDQHELVGTICLWNISKQHSSAEIGYELLPQHHGKGIMHEAVPEIIQYGFEKMKLKSIIAELSPRNLKSIKLLVRNHFTRVLTGEEKPDTIIYALQNSL